MRCIALILLCATAACSSDASTAGAPDAGPSPAIRGKYLVDSVLSCGDCHTPRAASGAPIAAKYLSGVECFIDVHPPATDGMVCLHSRNLTNDATGLKGFTDAQVKTMLTLGVLPSGQALSPVMPAWIYHALTDDDADAVVAYLRTVTAVPHLVPANEAPFDTVEAASGLVDDELPIATSGPQAGHSHGRYLAAIACLDCHSPDATPAPPLGRPQDIGRAFRGGRDFKAALLGLPTPPFPADIHSSNLTPDATGLAGWNAADISRVLRTGVDKDGHTLCPPMPFGPMGGFAGLTDADATAIADYLLHLPAMPNSVPGECFAPGAP